MVNDFIGETEAEVKNPPLIRRVRDYIFATYAFPLGMNVTVLFWTLYSIDRELVFPRVMDPIYPWWLNHILHTNVFTFVLIDLFFSYHHYSSRKAELVGLSAFVVAYIGWVYIVKFIAGAWVYPVLNVLDIHQRIGFFIIAGAIPFVLYFVGEYLNSKVWAKHGLVNEKRHQN